MNERKGFKLVYKDSKGKRWSIIKGWRGYTTQTYTKKGKKKIFDIASFAIRYDKDTWTEKKQQQGPLVVFNNRGDAHSFFASDTSPGKQRRELWECVYVPSKSSNMWFALKNRIWNYSKRLRVPSGTKFAVRIKLTKLIKT